MKTLTILILVLFMTSCSDNDSNNEVSLDHCSESTFVKELTEDIQVTVKHVEDGQPFYNGSKIYYEVEVDKYLKDVLGSNPPEIIRLFPINKTNNNIGSQIKVKGTITSCITGDHGLYINILVGFYLLEQ